MKIHGVVLAAGRGARMSGRTPKLLLPIPSAAGREPILRASVRNALGSSLDRVFLILGHDPDRHVAALGDVATDARLSIVRNPLWPEGRSTSIRLGFAQAAAAGADAVCFLCADQPLVSSAVVDRVLEASRRPGATLAFPLRRDGQKGNPVVYSVSLREELENSASGDAGALDLVKSRWDQAEKVPLTEEETLAQRDVDDAADYSAIVADAARAGSLDPETSPSPARAPLPAPEPEPAPGRGEPREERPAGAMPRAARRSGR